MKNRISEDIRNEGMSQFPTYKPPKNENIGTFAGMCLAHGMDIDGQRIEHEK